VSWSLSFIVPFVIGRYSLFDFALAEFLFSGVLSVGLLWRNAPAVRLLTRDDWFAACSLGLVGYVCYFLAVMGAAVYAGPVIAPAFLGLVPVVLAIAGNLRQRTVAWPSLLLPLTLATIGLLLVNCGSFLRSGSVNVHTVMIGIPLALLAVTFWTSFGLLNQSALARRPHMDAGLWTALIMAGAGLTVLMLMPIGLGLGLFEIPRLGLGWSSAGPMILWAAGLAIFANVGGALAWTYASQRLPVALCAQLITMEPTSATILGLLVHRRWPTPAEVLGMTLLLIGVVIAIAVFARATTAAARIALFCALGILGSGAALPADLGPVSLTVPEGFEGPEMNAEGDGLTAAWVKRPVGTVGGTLLQVSTVDLGNSLDGITAEQRVEAAKHYLLEFIKGVSQQRDSFELGTVDAVTLAGLPAARVRWTGRRGVTPSIGVMYCVLVGHSLVNFRTQDEGSQITPAMYSAITAIEAMRVR
jgi:drug/metabolite transporter (DMT)-like permease